MIKINLLPEKVRSAEKLRTSILLGSLATVVVVVGIAYLYFQQLRQLSALKVQVEEKVKEANSDKFKKIMKDLQEYTDLQSGLQVNKGVVDKFREKQIFWIKVLDALPDVVPAQVWLTSFTHALEKGKVVLTMRASATSPDEAAHFYSNLENYDFFKNVNLQAITSAVYNNAIVVNFIITTELEGV